MLATALRDVLFQQALQGKRPAVVVMTKEHFSEFVADLTSRKDVFEPIIFQGVQVVADEQVLMLPS